MLHNFFCIWFHARRTAGSITPGIPNDPSYQQRYIPSFDDERRTSDIVKNRNPTSSAGNPFENNNAKIDNYNDLSIYSNRKSAGQRFLSDLSNDHRDFGGAFFRSSFADGRLNFASNLDNDFPSYKSVTVHSGPFQVFSRPILVSDGVSRNKSPTDFGFWTNPTKYHNPAANYFNRQHNQGLFNNGYKSQSQGIFATRKQNELATGNYAIGKAFRPAFGNPYNFDASGIKISNKGFKDTSDLWTPVLSTAFRNFGARITERSKCKC